MNEVYFRKLAEELIGEKAKTIWSILSVDYEFFIKENFEGYGAFTRYWTHHKCSEVYICSTWKEVFGDKKYPDSLLIEEFVQKRRGYRLDGWIWFE
jgi:hypothetical protein